MGCHCATFRRIRAYNAAVMKISVELVHHINGSLVVSGDERLRSQIFTVVVDEVPSTEFVDKLISRVTSNNHEEFNFVYCVHSRDVYVLSTTAFFIQAPNLASHCDGFSIMAPSIHKIEKKSDRIPDISELKTDYIDSQLLLNKCSHDF